MKQLLKDIAEIGAGQGAPQGESHYCDNGTPFVKAGNLQELVEGKNINEIQNVSEEVATQHRLKLYPRGTILFAKSGMSCMKGYVYVLPRDAYVVCHLACILPKEPLSEYLRYYFLFHKPNQLVKNEAYPSISLGDISDLEIDIISISERNVIVNQLNYIETIIKQRQTELLMLDELIKARFVEMFGDPVENPMGWCVKSLLSMGKCKNGMNFHNDEKGITINCLGVSDFKDNSVISKIDLLPKISLNDMPSEEYLLKDDDIVFVRSNGNKALVGRSVSVYPGKTPTTFSGFCIRYRKEDESITIPYLLRVLKSESMRKMMAGRGANIQNLNQQILGKINVPVPPMDLQIQFSNFMYQINKSKFAYLNNLEFPNN